MANKNETPTWLKVMQNGSIGEARTRAFLIDRFWILERSVDIEGADFIIQRRITRHNLLDQQPPRLGLVQAKYYDAATTTHYIPKDYILDSDDKPRDEFFVILHTGHDDDDSLYYMTARTVAEDFEISLKDGVDRYRLSGTHILQNSKYKVTSKKIVLDRIEHQLQLADFTKNRMFLSWQLKSAAVDTAAILPDFKEPLNNWWGDIPKGFKEIKEKAINAMHELELQHGRLSKIAEETDPIVAFDILSDMASDCRNGRGDWSVDIPSLYDQDFENVCRQHADQVNNLRSKGLLDTFINLRRPLQKNIGGFLAQNVPIDGNTIYSVKIKFSLTDLSLERFEHQLIPATTYFNISPVLNNFGFVDIGRHDHQGTNHIADGEFELFWLAGRIGINAEGKADLKKYYATQDFDIYDKCLEQIYWEIE